MKKYISIAILVFCFKMQNMGQIKRDSSTFLLDKTFLTTTILNSEVSNTCSWQVVNAMSKNLVKNDVFNIYKQLTYYQQTNSLPIIDTLYNKIRRYTKNNGGVVPIVMLDFKYNYFKSNVLQDTIIKYDSILKRYKNVIGKTKAIYNEARFFSASPPIDRYINTVKFYVGNEFYFTNNTKPLSVNIDFGDGLGIREVLLGTIITVNYTNNNAKTLNVILPNSPTPLSSKLVSSPEYCQGNYPAVSQFLTCTATIPFVSPTTFVAHPFSNYTNTNFGVLDAYVKFSNSNPSNLYRRPIVFVEGVDFGELTGSLWNGMGKSIRNGDFGWCEFWGRSFDPSNAKPRAGFPEFRESATILNQALADGFDIILVDFKDGADYIERNGFALVELLKQIHQDQIGRGYDYEPAVVVGASMGGQVAKFALRYMEMNNLKHCTREYISFDSPQKGANLPLGFQAWIEFFANNGIGDADAAETLEGSFARPATRQLLVSHVYDPKYGTNFANDHVDFYNKMGQMGYPKFCRSTAIASGHRNGIGQEFLSPGDMMLRSSWAPGLCLPVPATQRFIIGDSYAIGGGIYFSGKVPKSAATVIGCVSSLIFCGLCANIGSFFDGKVVSTTGNVTNWDNAPGGYRETNEDIAEIFSGSRPNWPNFSASANPLNKPHAPHQAFIPLTSALDINTSNINIDIYNSIGFNPSNSSTYKSTDNPFPSLHPFEAIYASSTNQKHVFLEAAITTPNAEYFSNINWAIKEVRKGMRTLPPILNSASLNSGVYNLARPEQRFVQSTVIGNGGSLYINGNLPSDFAAATPALQLPFVVTPIAGSALTAQSCNCNNMKIEVQSGGKLVLGDNTSGNKGNFIFRSGSTLELKSGSILEIHNGSQLIIEDGATLIIQNGAIIRLMGNNALFDIQNPNYNLVIPVGTSSIVFTKHTATLGGTFQWMGNLSWAASSLNSLVSEGVKLVCKGSVTYNNGNKIVLKQSESCLDIAGTLSIGTNAKFTFSKGTATDGGYFRFSNPTLVSTPWGQVSPNIITASTGSSFELIGAGKTDKVLEVTMFWLTFPAQLSSFKIQSGMVENTTVSGFGEVVVSSPLIVDDVKFIATIPSNTGSRALEFYGQSHTINYCEFRNFTQGALYYGDYYNNLLKVTSCLFQGCRRGIMGYKDGGVNLLSNSFTNNTRGVQMENAILASTIQNNIFTNTIYENTNGAYHLNGANRSFFGVKYVGASDLHVKDNTIKGLYHGLMVDNNRLNLQCNYFNNIQNSALFFSNGTLNMSAKTTNGGHNSFVNNGFAHLRLLDMNEPNILFMSGYNYFKMATSNVSVNYNQSEIENVRGIYDFSYGSANFNLRTSNVNNESNTSNPNTPSNLSLAGPTKEIFPLFTYGTFYSVSPPVNTQTQLKLSRNYWLPIPLSPLYKPFSLFEDYNNIPEPIADWTEINKASEIFSCGDTIPCPPNIICDELSARFANVCPTCDKISIQDLGFVPSNIAALRAKNIMENKAEVNRYAKSFALFTEIERNSNVLQGKENQLVFNYINEGLITSLSHGLESKEINTKDNRSNLFNLEQALKNHIKTEVNQTREIQLKKVELLKKVAHIQHLQDENSSAVNTINQAINVSSKSKSSSILEPEQEVELSKLKCFYELSHQYNQGEISRELFSLALLKCYSEIPSIEIFDEESNSNFDITDELKNAESVMPIINHQTNSENKESQLDEMNSESNNLFSLVPNPAQNRVTLQSKLNVDNGYFILNDMNGKVVMNKSISIKAQEGLTIDFNLIPGVYVYSIITENAVLMRSKLIIIAKN